MALITHFKFDETTGNTVKNEINNLDYTVNTFNGGTYNLNTPSISLNPNPGTSITINKAYVNIAEHTLQQTFDLNTPMSFAMFFKANASLSYSRLLSQAAPTGTTTDPFFTVYINANVVVVVIRDDSNNQDSLIFTNSSYFNLNEHHIVITYDGVSKQNGFKVYIDKIEIPLTNTPSASTYGSVAPGIVNREIGKQVNTIYNYFDGVIDDYKEFDTALTQTEIDTLFPFAPKPNPDDNLPTPIHYLNEMKAYDVLSNDLNVTPTTTVQIVSVTGGTAVVNSNREIEYTPTSTSNNVVTYSLDNNLTSTLTIRVTKKYNINLSNEYGQIVADAEYIELVLPSPTTPNQQRERFVLFLTKSNITTTDVQLTFTSPNNILWENNNKPIRIRDDRLQDTFKIEFWKDDLSSYDWLASYIDYYGQSSGA